MRKFFKRLIACLVFIHLIILTSAMLSSCKHEPIAPLSPPPATADTSKPINYGPPCSPDTVYFQRDILPLLVSNCAMSGCHEPAYATPQGFNPADYAHIVMDPYVRPGRPDLSEIYDVVYDCISADSEDRMPPSPHAALTVAQVALFKKWILQGAKNNNCTDTSCRSGKQGYADAIQPLIATYCLGCHRSPINSGNISLETYANVANLAHNGKLDGVIRHKNGFIAMPQYEDSLQPCQIQEIEKWIAQGAPNN